MFAVALHAWKTGGGWRELPVPHIACSGIPARADAEEWKAVAGGDSRIENALVRLHILFRDADSLGSLIDPKSAVQVTSPAGLQRSLDDVGWDEVAPLVAAALENESVNDAGTSVLGADAATLARAADLLSRRYWLVATNVPFLAGGRFTEILTNRSQLAVDGADVDLATVMLDRATRMAHPGGRIAVVSPQNWTTAMPAFARFRKAFGAVSTIGLLARLGPGAFSSISGEVVQPCLLVATVAAPTSASTMHILDRHRGTAGSIAAWLAEAQLVSVNQVSALKRPGSALSEDIWGEAKPVAAYARAFAGAQTGDDGRYRRYFWELSSLRDWDTYQTSGRSVSSQGFQSVVRLRGVDGAENGPGAVIRGTGAWGKPGLAVARTSLAAAPYASGPFNDSITVLVPHRADDLVVLWAYVTSDEFEPSVRALSRQVKVGNKIFEKLPLDYERFRSLAAHSFPDGAPPAGKQEPTQWFFSGHPVGSTNPLQVAVARLLGYRWPEQDESDGLDRFRDADGIVCLPSVAGEPPAADRLQQVLSAAFRSMWSLAKQNELLDGTGSSRKTLDDWLRDDFFKQHCVLFGHRPFVWHVWDGQRNGFGALVNYQRLNRKTLEKLTYTYLGDWIERQRAEVRDEKAGAETRLAAASKLRRSLELILEGEPPYDIYVRWKSLAKQPIGWDPAVEDGVRVNVRPFVRAGVLRSTFTIKWDNLDGEHAATSEKRSARGESA